MSTRQYALTIYIHPETGPTLPVQIDTLQVEVAALSVGPSERNKARVNEVSRQIKDCFKGVYPEHGKDAIAAIMSRLENLTMFSGVVLQLPGAIEDDTTYRVKKAENIARDHSRLKGEASQQRDLIEKLQVDREMLSDRLNAALAAKKQLKLDYDRANAKVAALEVQLKQTHEKAAALVKEKSDLQSQLAAKEVELRKAMAGGA